MIYVCMYLLIWNMQFRATGVCLTCAISCLLRDRRLFPAATPTEIQACFSFVLWIFTRLLYGIVNNIAFLTF